MNYYFPPIVIWFLEFVPNIFVVMVYFPFLSRIVFFFIIIFCVIRQPCHINKYETKHTENSDHAHFESSTRQGVAPLGLICRWVYHKTVLKVS